MTISGQCLTAAKRAKLRTKLAAMTKAKRKIADQKMARFVKQAVENVPGAQSQNIKDDIAQSLITEFGL